MACDEEAVISSQGRVQIGIASCKSGRSSTQSAFNAKRACRTTHELYFFNSLADVGRCLD